MGRIIKAAAIRNQAASRPEVAPAGSSGHTVSPEALKGAVMKMAQEMTRQLVGSAVEHHPELLEAVYRRAFGMVALGPDVRITVHPDDMDAVPRSLLNGARLERDAEVGRGGYRLRGEWGELDGSIDTLLCVFGAAMGASK